MDVEKVCIFVDGENLRHTITDLFSPMHFDPDDYLPKKGRWENLFNSLVAEVSLRGLGIRLRTYWYVVEHIDFFPYNLPFPDKNLDGLVKILSKNKDYRDGLRDLVDNELEAKARVYRDELIENQNKFVKKFRGWQTIQDGITGKHKSLEFRRAGAITYNLFKGYLSKEKSVDVKLATDLIILSDIYDTAIIVSGDQDFVPAVAAIKDKGKRVVNVAFKKRSGKLLPGGARRLNFVTDSNIALSYNDFKKYLAL